MNDVRSSDLRRFPHFDPTLYPLEENLGALLGFPAFSTYETNRGVIGMSNDLVFEKLQWRRVAQCPIGCNEVICLLLMIEFRVVQGRSCT